jgi:hypothetical protein
MRSQSPICGRPVIEWAALVVVDKRLYIREKPPSSAAMRNEGEVNNGSARDEKIQFVFPDN